ncbi:ATP-binding cassette domain-containing protein [Myxococcota bacterium]|nr:ATP-binding cassette domain-containing protein [Myxococcota bacterium]
MGIVAKNLHKQFGETRVIRGVSLSVEPGEMVSLLGPSGGGKSTVLRILAGLERADAGEVWLDGQRVDHLDAASRGVGFVFQHYALFRHMRVVDNVAFGLKVRKVNPDEARRRAEALLARVGLGGLSERWPDELSGGQRQRVALARALAPAPRVLLLDEPFGALDARVRADLREWLRRLHDEVGATTVLVTHDQEEALSVSDRVVLVRDGLIEQDGSPAEIVDSPRTEFVARFVGEVNVVEGVVDAEGLLVAGGLRLRVPGAVKAGTRLRAVLRSHELQVLADPAGRGVVRRVVPLDDRARVELTLDGASLVARVPRAEAQALHVGSAVGVASQGPARVWAIEA